MTFSSISRNSILLALFAALTTAIIAGTYLLTKERIAEQQRQAESRALLEIFPADTHDNQPLDDFITISEAPLLSLKKQSAKASNNPYKIHIARQQNEVSGFIFPAIAPEGYADKIQLLVGIQANGKVAGVRVVSHKETPGLGDAIEIKKSGWILGFNGKSLSDPKKSMWAVKKDKGYFDQFTGATITPRAITKAVLNTLEYYQENQESLLKSAVLKSTEQNMQQKAK